MEKSGRVLGRVTNATSTEILITCPEEMDIPAIGTLVNAPSREGLEVLAIVVGVERTGDVFTRQMAGEHVDPGYLADNAKRTSIVCRAVVVGKRKGHDLSGRMPEYPASLLGQAETCEGETVHKFIWREGKGWDFCWLDRLLNGGDDAIVQTVEWLVKTLPAGMTEDFLIETGRALVGRIGIDLLRAYRILRGIKDIEQEIQLQTQ